MSEENDVKSLLLTVELNLLPGEYPPLEVDGKPAAFINVEYNGTSTT